MNNENLYLRLLTKFRDSQGGFADLFAAARADADETAATRAAHTLRGTAGNMGATGVQAAAEALEMACQSGAAAQDIDRLLAQTLQQLAPVIAGLQTLGTSPEATASDSPSPASGVDAARFKPQIELLTLLLKDGSVDALDAAEKLEELANGTPLAGLAKSVAAAVADCDYDAALATLQQAGA